MIQALPRESEVLGELVAWGETEPSIRAMVLTSSRARLDGPVDLLSDYDLILAVTDAGRFRGDDAWLSDYGRPIVRWTDQGELYGLITWFRGVVYENGVKIDYSVWPLALLERISAEDALPDCLDVGYRVLLDKDRRTSGWAPPSYQAHIPPRPTEAEYRALVEEFWWTATYVAKSLWRGELVFARFCLDHDIKLETMRRLLEWRIEIDRGWSVKPGVYGRGLERLLPAEIWTWLAGTYVGPEIEENWAALFRAAALFRRVAAEVGSALGYAYPQEVDDRVGVYLDAIRNLPRGAEPPVHDPPDGIPAAGATNR